MMIRMVGGWVFLLVLAYPGSPGQRVVKRFLLLLLCCSFSVLMLFIGWFMWHSLGVTCVHLCQVTWDSRCVIEAAGDEHSQFCSMCSCPNVWFLIRCQLYYVLCYNVFIRLSLNGFIRHWNGIRREDGQLCKSWRFSFGNPAAWAGINPEN